MKKLVPILIVILVFLSGCYSITDIEEIKEEIKDQCDAEYFELEKLYDAECETSDELGSALAKIYDEYLILWSYFEGYDDCTENDVRNAVKNMGDIFDALEM